MAVYVGVNGASREVSKIFVGVNGAAREVTEAYVGVNGAAKLVYRNAPKMEVFTTSGLYTIPDNVTELEVFLVGGGGGARGSSCTYNYVADDSVFGATNPGGGGYTTTTRINPSEYTDRTIAITIGYENFFGAPEYFYSGGITCITDKSVGVINVANNDYNTNIYDTRLRVYAMGGHCGYERINTMYNDDTYIFNNSSGGSAGGNIRELGDSLWGTGTIAPVHLDGYSDGAGAVYSSIHYDEDGVHHHESYNNEIRECLGQGYTTRAFGESNGTLYSGGGGAYGGGIGGAGGGGNGSYGDGDACIRSTGGGYGTGGGGGGEYHIGNDGNHNPLSEGNGIPRGYGGTGCCLLRAAR